jgi:hypothetical protein
MSVATTPGIYAIYVDGSLMYIGQSCALAYRILTHVQRRKLGINTTVKVALMPGSTELQRKKREHALLMRLQPAWNVDFNAPYGERWWSARNTRKITYLCTLRAAVNGGRTPDEDHIARLREAAAEVDAVAAKYGWYTNEFSDRAPM